MGLCSSSTLHYLSYTESSTAPCEFTEDGLLFMDEDWLNREITRLRNAEVFTQTANTNIFHSLCDREVRELFIEKVSTPEQMPSLFRHVISIHEREHLSPFRIIFQWKNDSTVRECVNSLATTLRLNPLFQDRNRVINLPVDWGYFLPQKKTPEIALVWYKHLEKCKSYDKVFFDNARLHANNKFLNETYDINDWKGLFIPRYFDIEGSPDPQNRVKEVFILGDDQGAKCLIHLLFDKKETFREFMLEMSQFLGAEWPLFKKQGENIEKTMFREQILPETSVVIEEVSDDASSTKDD